MSKSKIGATAGNRKTTNIFNGISSYAQFANATYKLFMSREWITYTHVMQHSGKLDSECISKCRAYGELKKAFRDIIQIINQKLGEECFEVSGNNRCRSFRYIGSEDDPLADMRNARIIDDLRKYWQFCQDSAGFFPTSWLDYFFEGSKDLLDMKFKKSSGEQVISSSLDRELAKIELLPQIYEAIKKQQVLAVTYNTSYEKEESLIVHPHLLKEFNGRWYLFCHAEEHEPRYGFSVALDRIVFQPKIICNQEYINAPRNFYQQYFKNIVGVSHFPNQSCTPIHIRAHGKYMFNLIGSKPIHSSQGTLKPYEENDNYGDFQIAVEINNEFIGRILQMGDQLEVIAPKEVRDLFREKVRALNARYEY